MVLLSALILTVRDMRALPSAVKPVEFHFCLSLCFMAHVGTRKGHNTTCLSPFLSFFASLSLSLSVSLASFSIFCGSVFGGQEIKELLPPWDVFNDTNLVCRGAECLCDSLPSLQQEQQTLYVCMCVCVCVYE